MKKILIVLTCLFSLNVFAETHHLVCMMGEMDSMDIKIEEQGDGKEKLSVNLSAMDGGRERTFVNTNFMNHSASQGLKEGKIQAILSKTNLVASFDGAFLDAGVLELNKNKDTQKNDVIFAAEGLVYVATCTEQ
ncbi:MAG: hypothetical protein ACXWRE_04310 [Pseudobdellovibrionaceae bacterium]